MEDSSVGSSEVVVPERGREREKETSQFREKTRRDRRERREIDSLLLLPALVGVKSIGFEDLNEHLSETSSGKIDLISRKRHRDVEDGVVRQILLGERSHLGRSRVLPLLPLVCDGLEGGSRGS